jgi:predicted AAA+ superfamily ATPase
VKRFLYTQLIDHLPTKQISLLVGARQVGKTTLLRQVFDELKQREEAVFFLTLEDRRILDLLNASPQNLAQLIPMTAELNRIYVLIDEVQYLDDPSNFLKFHYDTSGDRLKFVATGSSHFYIDRKFRDSMAGRKRIFELPSLSLDEVFHFRGEDELCPFLGQQDIPLVYRDEMLKHFYDYLVFGGYPEVVLSSSLSDRKELLLELRNSYAKKDAQEAGLRHPDLYLRMMKMLADQIGSLLNINSIATELGADGKTLQNYLWVMRKSFHVYCPAPFHKRIASELRKMPKLYFADLGLRNSLLNNFSPIGEREDRGDLLENYTYLRLRKERDEESVKFWRTQNQQEVDFVILHDNGSSEAIEVKYTEKSFRESKYAHFRKTYPETPLRCVSLENILML